MGKLKDLTGQRFNKLVVTSFHGKDSKGNSMWNCKCDCGNEKPIRGCSLVSKNTTACGCRRFGSSQPQWTGVGEMTGNFWSQFLNSAKHRGEFTKYEVSITKQEAWDLFLKQDRKCAISGLPITLAKSTKEQFTASLDRIDSNKGYSLENIQWVHKHINMMKQAYSKDYFIQMCKEVAKYNE